MYFLFFFYFSVFLNEIFFCLKLGEFEACSAQTVAAFCLRKFCFVEALVTPVDTVVFTGFVLSMLLFFFFFFFL